MPVEIQSNYPSLQRFRTGLFSLDMAMRDRAKIGVPLRTILELYGYPNVGKSTLSYFIASRATDKGNVSICDVELCDGDYVKVCSENAGLDGIVKIVDPVDKKGKFVPHEEMLISSARDLYEEDFGALVLDSVGAVQSNKELDVLLNEKEKMGQAFWGKRAKLIAQFSRAVTAALRNKQRPSLAIIINHVHQIMGGMGHTTAGGETLKYMAASRVMLWPGTTYFADTTKKTDVLGFLVQGQVEKLRYGARGKKFQFYIVPGYGVHEGVSAVFDCLEYGIAESKTKVKIGDKIFGYLRADLLKAAAEGNTRKFKAFQEELANRENELLVELTGEGNGGEDDSS